MNPLTLERTLRRAGVRSECRRTPSTPLPEGWTEEELWEEWQFLANPHASVESEAKRLAPRLGMEVKTVHAAIRRLNARNSSTSTNKKAS